MKFAIERLNDKVDVEEADGFELRFGHLLLFNWVPGLFFKKSSREWLAMLPPGEWKQIVRLL